MPRHPPAMPNFFSTNSARNGTTTACVYCTAPSVVSAEALFAAAHRRNAGMIAGNAADEPERPRRD